MAKISRFPVSEPPLLRIEQFKGVNYSVTPTQIDYNQSPDMLNMNVDERGALNKRTGYTKVFPSLGSGKINGLFEFKGNLFVAHGTKLYKVINNEPTEIYNGLNNGPLDTFVMSGKLYLLDGVNYLQYDGTTVSTVTPYIPVLTISGLPVSGGGTGLEDFNLLGSGFTEKFSGDNTGKVFPMSLKGLDATLVTAKVDNVAKVETTDFTVDRVNGTVTFITAPPTGTNNVEITAYKTFADKPNFIKKCTMHVLFGGTNDTRVFISGNPDFPNQLWRSGVYDATYFPENGFYKVGSDKEKITGFSKQYDYLVIDKETSKGNMQFQLSDTGQVSFPIKPLNDQIGTIAPKSIQIIDNSPISLSKKGVYRLDQSNVRDERNVVHISTNIDRVLLKEPGLELANSIDYDQKYWLALNSRVYVYDYLIEEWYLYDNIPASCFLEYNNNLYFGSSSEGVLYRFKKEDEASPYHDDGIPINAYWKSKQLNFEAGEILKTVEKVHFTLKPGSQTSADLYYITNKKVSDVIKTKRMDLMSFFLFDFNRFSFINSAFPQETVVKIKVKKITHFQLTLSNNRLNESLGILSIGIKYQYGSNVK